MLPCELAYGVLRVADAPSISHQRMVGELFLSLTAFVRARRLGEVLLAPTDVVLDFDRALVVQPDLVFVSSERSHIAADRIYGAPDLAIEILSPHARVGRVDEQVGWFAQYGVRECWLVELAAPPDCRAGAQRTGRGVPSHAAPLRRAARLRCASGFRVAGPLCLIASWGDGADGRLTRSHLGGRLAAAAAVSFTGVQKVRRFIFLNKKLLIS